MIYQHSDLIKTLTQVIVPEGVSEIASGVFQNCEMLSDISLPDTLNRIGEGAFSRCLRLRHIDIPASVTNIAVNAFLGCTRLKTVSVADKKGIAPEIFACHPGVNIVCRNK